MRASSRRLSRGTWSIKALLTHVTTDMDVFGSEIFGPAQSSTRDSADAAVDLANHTSTATAVISRPRAPDVVSRVRSGIIHVNHQASHSPSPFALKLPTSSRTAGIGSFTEQRWVTIQHEGRPTYPF